MTPYIQVLITMTGDKLQQRMQKDPETASDSLLISMTRFRVACCRIRCYHPETNSPGR